MSEKLNQLVCIWLAFLVKPAESSDVYAKSTQASLWPPVLAAHGSTNVFSTPLSVGSHTSNCGNSLPEFFFGVDISGRQIPTHDILGLVFEDGPRRTLHGSAGDLLSVFPNDLM